MREGINQLLVLLGLATLACGGRARVTGDAPMTGVTANSGTSGAGKGGSGGFAETTEFGGLGGLEALAGTGARGSGTGGASSGEGGADGFEGPQPCNDPSQVFSGGIVTCKSGIEHRVSPETCPTTAGCRNDADCAPNELCECALVMNYCIQTACHADVECGPGLLCVSGAAEGYIGFVCQTARDECTTTCPPDRGTCVVQQKRDGTYWRTCRVLEGSGGSGPL